MRTPVNVLKVRAEFDGALLELGRLGQRADVLLDEIRALRVLRGPTYFQWLWAGLTGKGWNYEIV